MTRVQIAVLKNTAMEIKVNKSGSAKDVHMNNNTLVYMLSCIELRKFG